ncbi:MAG: hypothetical protein H0W99_06050, partial [Acidobacteria bacterium]|nr:hypothetical protein [Acidobacteriota bacterium]
FNEGPDGKGGTSYNLLYPTPSANNGSAQLAADQQMQTGWYVFDRNQGTEKFWIVWSTEPVADLEAVKGVVNPQDKGAIKDRGKAEAVRAFLSRGNTSRPEVHKVDKQSVIRSTGDVSVNLVELEHH